MFKGWRGLSQEAAARLVTLRPRTVKEALKIPGVGRETTKRLLALGVLSDPDRAQDEVRRPLALDLVRAVRRDLGHLLFHFTRTPDRQPGAPTSALWNLSNILRAGVLRGGTGKIKGAHVCVCFTEAPIAELAAVFALIGAQHKDRYEPYGIGVSKSWLFERGGRPVIYQSAREYDLLPDALKHRHVTYDPAKEIDFTWEREWRVHAAELKLSPAHAVVVVPTRDEAYGLMYDHAEEEPNVVDIGEGRVESTWPKPTWTAVSLDLFGFELPRAATPKPK